MYLVRLLLKRLDDVLVWFFIMLLRCLMLLSKRGYLELRSDDDAGC